MKFIVKIAASLVFLAANLHAVCSEQAAMEKGLEVSNYLASMHRFGMMSTTSIRTDLDHYYVKVSYDNGLNVPTYTVTMDFAQCLVTNVEYSNEEG